MAGPFTLIDRSLSRATGAMKGGYPGQLGAKPRKARDLNDPKTLEYLRRMHPDFDEVMAGAQIDYRTQCHTDASFASKFRIPHVLEPQRSFRDHTNSVDAVCWLPERDSFISASHDKTLKVWDASRGSCTDTLNGHVSGVYHCAVARSGKFVVSCASGQEKNVLLWSWPEKKVARALGGHARSALHADVSPDSTQVSTAGQDGTVIVHDVATGNAVFKRNVHLGRCQSTSYCRENSHMLISAGMDDSLHLLDLREHQACVQPSVVANSVYTNTGLTVRSAHDGYGIHAVKFFDTTTAYSGGADHKLRRWDLRKMSPFKPQCSAEYLGHTAPVRSLSVSGDGKFLLTGCEDGSLRLWPKDPLGEMRETLRSLRMEVRDLDTDKQDFGRPAAERQALAEKQDRVKAQIASLRKDEEQLARDGYVPALRALTGHVAQVSACDWQEDQHNKAVRIVSSSWDQTVQLFNISLESLR